MTAPPALPVLAALLAALPRAPARLLHAGPGAAATLAALEGAAVPVTVLSPDPVEAAALSRAGAAAEVAVLAPATPDHPDGAARPLRRANFPALDSLVPAAPELLALFPGFRVLAEEPVSCRDPAALVAALDPGGAGGLVLVLDAPGMAGAVLQALAAADLLTRFDGIALRAERAPLFRDAVPLAGIRALLDTAGFACWAERDPADPDRPWLGARLDRAALETRARIAALEAELAQVRAAAEAELSALRATDADRAEQVEALQAETVAMRTARDAAQAELETVQARLETARQAAETGHATQAEALRAARDEAETLRGWLARSREEMRRAEGQIAMLTELFLDGDGL